VISVIGFSPAVDVTYVVDKLVPGTSHKVTNKITKAGGKSVNVASVLHTLGESCQLILPLGGQSGEFIASDLSERKIQLIAQKITQSTRTCVAIVTDEATVLNEPAAVMSEQEYDMFEKLVIEKTRDANIVIFSGSMPGDYSTERFQDLVGSIRTTGNFVIVDSSGSYLKSAAIAGADLLKPNTDELAEVFPNQNADEAIQMLLELGAGAVYLSAGSEGGRYQSKQLTLEVSVPKVSGNATGAGDAFVAGFAKSVADDLPLDQILGFASACASAAVLEDSAGEISIEQVSVLRPKVKVVTS
jgi:tagatose 6-phosphate kinase